MGTGELKDTVNAVIQKNAIKGNVQMIDRIPNSDIWELYRFVEAFINLNQQEIFGMAILEAMYYGCKVIAWEAPGPNLIIENGISGWLVASDKDVIDKVQDKTDMSLAAHKRIKDNFTWNNAANIIQQLLRGENNEQEN